MARTRRRGQPPIDPNRAGWPATTGNPSGKGRGYRPSEDAPKHDPKGAGWPSKTGKPSGKGRGYNPPVVKKNSEKAASTNKGGKK